MAFRKPNQAEARLLGALAQVGKLPNAEAWLDSLRVRELADDGMGSLEFDTKPEVVLTGIVICLAAVRFIDSDGVEVIASLNATVDGIPFELDIWKIDFSGLIQIPVSFEVFEKPS